MVKRKGEPLPDRFLKPPELAEMLGVPLSTIYQWRYTGDGPPGFRVGRHVRYDPAVVRRWIDNRTTDPDDRAA